LNLDLYVQSKGLQDEAPKSKLLSKVQADDDGFQNLNSKSESVRSRTRRNKDWKGLVGRDTDRDGINEVGLDHGPSPRVWKVYKRKRTKAAMIGDVAI
jgi:hypothetical protein